MINIFKPLFTSTEVQVHFSTSHALSNALPLSHIITFEPSSWFFLFFLYFCWKKRIPFGSCLNELVPETGSREEEEVMGN